MSIKDKQWLDLSEGEEVLWWNHPHIIHYADAIGGAFILMLGGIALTLKDIPFITEGAYPLLLVPVGLGLLIWQFLRRSFHYYVATDQKIIEKRGIVSRTRDPIHYDRIQDTFTDESVLERLVSVLPGVNIGDIIISTAATDRAELVLYDIPNVNSVSRLIDDSMQLTDGSEASMRTQSNAHQPVTDDSYGQESEYGRGPPPNEDAPEYGSGPPNTGTDHGSSHQPDSHQ